MVFRCKKNKDLVQMKIRITTKTIKSILKDFKGGSISDALWLDLWKALEWPGRLTIYPIFLLLGWSLAICMLPIILFISLFEIERSPIVYKDKLTYKLKRFFWKYDY